MVAQRIDCYTTDLRVFTGHVVFGNHALNFVSKSFIEGSLASNRSPAGGFGSSPGFKHFAPALRLHAS
jgi:hypothetical protein